MTALTEPAATKPETGKAVTAARRKPARAPEATPSPRYFLAKDQTSGSVPQFGKELTNENEALIESVRTGLPYYIVSEWKAVPDLSGKTPQIIKEPVVRPHS